MTPRMKGVRRLLAFERYRQATMLALQECDNIAAIILTNRACAYQALANGDDKEAREYRREAYWFASRDRTSALAAHIHTKRAIALVVRRWKYDRPALPVL